MTVGSDAPSSETAWLQTTATPTPTPAGTQTGFDPTRFFDWVGPPWVVDAFASLAVLLLAYFIGRAFVRLFGRRVSRRFRRPSLTRTVLRGVRVGVFLFALLTIMNIYGYGLGDIALSVTLFTAVLGVILAPIVGSIISGVFLLADQPYEIGDMVELADTNERGFVEDITLRYTKIFTLDNTFLVIPNGAMRDRDVVNYSAEDSRTRLMLDIVVTYESDVAEARTQIERAARDVDVVIEGGPDIRIGAARYPASPTCYIDEFGDHGIALSLRYWIEEPYKLLATRSEIQTNVWERFADADVEIAYPHSHLIFDETSGQLQVSMGEDGPFDHGVFEPGAESPPDTAHKGSSGRVDERPDEAGSDATE